MPIRIEIVDGLVENGMPISGRWDKQAGVIAINHRLVGDANFAARVIHHEMMHAMLSRTTACGTRLAKWSSGNPAGFTYVGAGFEQGTVAGVFGTGAPGFVNEYAMSGLEEDICETFSFMMCSTRDTIEKACVGPLGVKCGYITGFVHCASSDMGSLFWERITARR
jgi:hypothetical protein